MKMKLIHAQRVPYGGLYDINRPDLGIVGRGTTFDQLETNVRAYRLANGIPTGLGFNEELEQVVCEHYTVECEGCDPDLPLKRRLGMAEVVAGTKVLLALKLSGGQLVSPEVANQRYDICSRCPLNMAFPVPCSGLCPEIKTLVDAIIGPGNDKYKNEKRSCAICGCYTGSHVWLPYEILAKGLDAQMKRSFKVAQREFHCWKVEPETA